MNLIAMKVTNARHGVGTITAIEGDRMTVQFSDKISKFIYPDAFQKHIILDNHSLQDEMYAIATASIKKKEQEKEKVKTQIYKKVMQTVEAARNPAKESPGKSAYPQKTSSPTGRRNQ